MFNIIDQDSEKFPSLFVWNEPIEKEDLKLWFEEHSLYVPEDLIMFLSATGGGNMFESENILSPFGSQELGNDIESTNDWYLDNGLSDDLMIFNTGAYLSAVRLSDQKYVLLDSIDYEVESEFETFDDWYINTVRSGFAERYNLDSQ